MENNEFKSEAKQIVDMMFDNRMFNESVTRDHMSVFEDLIGYILTSRLESHKKAEKLMESIKTRPDGLK